MIFNYMYGNLVACFIAAKSCVSGIKSCFRNSQILYLKANSIFKKSSVHRRREDTVQFLYNPMFGVHRNGECCIKGNFTKKIIGKWLFSYNSFVKFLGAPYDCVISKSLFV